MKLQARLTLPPILIGSTAAVIVIIGLAFLIQFTFNDIFQSQGTNIGNIAIAVLDSRTDRMDREALRLLNMPGDFKLNALAARKNSHLSFAMELSGNRARVAYGSLPGQSCLSAISGSPMPSPLILASGNSLIIAGSARTLGSGRIVLVGQEIDTIFMRALKDLLLMDISMSAGNISVSSTSKMDDPNDDFVPSVMPIPGPCGKAYITMLVPSGEALKTFRHALAYSTGLILLILVIAIWVYVRLIRQVTRPILALNTAVEQIATGDLHAHIPTGGPDELGILVKRFNQMADSLKSAQDSLVRSAKLASVGEMVAGISHELNNPLSGLIGQAEYLASRMVPGHTPGMEEVQMILAEARRMKQTLAQLRGLIKPADADKTMVDVNHLMQDVFMLFRHESMKTGIRCELVPANPNLAVKGVPDQLRQVFLNLALNSQQAMPGGGLIRVDTDLIMHDGEKAAMIRFSDTGPGIPPGQFNRIFEPFYSGKPGSMGLGLAICREIINRHGGTIEATPGLESGSVFTIYLPVEPRA